eukprot:s8799_g2.t1
MESFLGKNAAAPLQDRIDGLRNLGWVVTKEIEDIHLSWVFNCAVKIKGLVTSHHGTVQIVDLNLSNTYDDPPSCRIPHVTGEVIQFDSTAFDQKVSVGEVYMLVGAKVFLDVRNERSLRFPPTAEHTASILLPTREDLVVSVMEMFCGGMTPWSRACRMLPAECVLKLDHEGMAISSVLLNEPHSILFSREGEQATFNVFWGEAIDLRWTAALHKTNTEVVCASPPCGAYTASSNAPGLQDAKATVAWFQMILVMRFLQRRVFVIESLPALAKHEDFKTFKNLFAWAGYNMVWSGLVDPVGLMPAEQKRLFMVLWNAADHPSAGAPFRLMQVPSRPDIPCKDSLWIRMPGEVLNTVKLSRNEITKVTSRELLPWYLQQREGSPIHLRCLNQGKPLPLLPGNYRTSLELPWMILKRKGLYVPLLYHGGDIRVLSKWEILRAYGFPHDFIMPDNEKDSLMLLGQCLMPCPALIVLASVLGHRQEDRLTNDDMLPYLDAALTEWREGWPDFGTLYPFNKNGWAILITRGDQLAMSPAGQLTRKLVGMQVEIDALTYGRDQGRSTPFLPETSRTLYEDMTQPPENPKTHRLFQVEHGYHDVILEEEDTIAEVNHKIAEFLQIPEEDLAVTKMTRPSPETEHWVLAGEIPSESYDKVLILADPAVPAAWWMTSEITVKDLKHTYADNHSAPPDYITVNGAEILQWPICIQSGDFIKMRWNHGSEMEAWRELDVFKQLDEEGRGNPPESPPKEDDESSPGGPDDDPPVGDHDGGPRTEPAHRRTPILWYRNRLRMHPPRQAMEATRKKRWTTSYPRSPTRNTDPRSLGRLAEDEWGVQPHMVYFTLGTKVLGHDTGCSQIPKGGTVILRGRLRGGTGQGQAVQKLRTILAAKGVPEENLDSRIQEIRSHIGDAGIKEAYSSWDPWSHLKSKVPTRLVREAEMKGKPKAKTVQQDEAVDPMQLHDPWTQALRERGAWKLETNFFRMEDGNPPPSLEKVTHGAKGIAFVNEREAELLTQSQELMSDYELAALVIGSHIQNPGRFSIKDIETPCRNKDNDRILVKAQLLNLGAKKISLQDEGSILTVDEIDAVVIACEAINEEMDEWDTFQEGPIKYLKKHIPSLEQGIIGTWARRFFLKNKQTSDAKGAQSCYFLMRVKRELVETVLKVVIPGMYFSPRNETGALDPDFKVIWFNDLPLQETILKANMEPQAFGVVRNKGGHGIRVKSQDFMKLKQKWQPAWKPMENTPYNLQIKNYFELQNMPLCCTKAEVQKFLNQITWEALALRQVKPRTWLVGAAKQPEKLVHLASHGTVLIAEKASKGSGKGKAEGKGQSAKGRPWWVAGSSTTPTMLAQRQNTQVQPQMTMDTDTTDLEDRIQRKMDQMHQESLASTKLLRQDFLNFQKDVITKQREQEIVNNQLAGNIQTLTANLSQELSQCITSAMATQRAEIASDIKVSQISLKEELMGEMRTQIGAMRKRTPSPSTKDDEAKKHKQ